MAELIIHTEKIRNNIKKLSAYFEKKDIKWSLITKVFSGDKAFLKYVLTQDILEKISSVGDSRLTSLKNLREVNPKLRTIYIKPPADIHADEIVEYANISLNSSLSTILALNRAAQKQDKIHEIIIMIELGELREGVNRSDIMDFYEQVFDLSNIEVIGIGSNLGCMYGVEPTYDKLLQLSLFKELISAKFKKDVLILSGGSSITLPLLEKNLVPKEINHFRIGEAAFFGISPLTNEPFLDLETDTFEFYANIIELEEKKVIPDGIISEANIGHTANINHEVSTNMSFKAILDFGLLDVDQKDLSLKDESIQFVGITSDMTVVDIGNSLYENKTPRYQVGDKLRFAPNYMAVARLLNSKFISKNFI